jgi:hypothetical protein
LPAPLPDPAPHNRDLELYADAVRKIAQERDAAFIDLFREVSKAREARRAKDASSQPDTDNGIHPTALGFWRLANLPAILPITLAKLDAGEVRKTERGLSVTTKGPLPPPLEPVPGREASAWKMTHAGLEPGRYTLKVDGRPLATHTAEEWAAAPLVRGNPQLERVEKLRQAIIAKNLLFFYRWRPQNITYLFGFRKHEQGQNAVEIPQFDPLVDAKEKEIAELRKPVPHTYELVRENEASR